MILKILLPQKSLKYFLQIVSPFVMQANKLLMLQERGQGSNQTCRLLQRQLTWLMKVERVSHLELYLY